MPITKEYGQRWCRDEESVWEIGSVEFWESTVKRESSVVPVQVPKKPIYTTVRKDISKERYLYMNSLQKQQQ